MVDLALMMLLLLAIRLYFGIGGQNQGRETCIIEMDMSIWVCYLAAIRLIRGHGRMD